MRIAVIGAGALGCLFGVRLDDTGNDVWLVHHREKYVRELSENGVRIRDDTGTRRLHAHVPATTDSSDVGPVDLALVLVKAHHTREAIEDHTACIGPETRVLSLQNGLRNRGKLRALVGADAAFTGVTYQAADLERPGIVYHTANGPCVFGGRDTAFAEQIETTFEEAGIPVEVVDDPRAHIWEKQLLAAAVMPLAALTRLEIGSLVEDDRFVEVMDRLLDEVVAVAEARDVDILTDDPLSDVVSACQAAPSHKSSALQDIEKGKKTEIGEVNGAIVSFAAEEGIDVPFNRTLVSLVQGLERSYLDG